MATDETPTSDQERISQMSRVIDEVLDDRWPEIEGMWMQEVRPAFGAALSDEDFIRHIATPLTMRMVSIGLQAGIESLTRNTKIFEKPFQVLVAPSGLVSIRLEDED